MKYKRGDISAGDHRRRETLLEVEGLGKEFVLGKYDISFVEKFMTSEIEKTDDLVAKEDM